MSAVPETTSAARPAVAPAARLAQFKREQAIVDFLNRGVSVAEIAVRFGVGEQRMRAVVRDILARRIPETPEEFAAIRASRLNEALLVAFSAMGSLNLKAVDLVIRIVRALDRCQAHAAGLRAGPPMAADLDEEAPELPDFSLDDDATPVEAEVEARRFVRTGDDATPMANAGRERETPFPPAARPEIPAQTPEKAHFAPETEARPTGHATADMPPSPRCGRSPVPLRFTREESGAAAFPPLRNAGEGDRAQPVGGGPRGHSGASTRPEIPAHVLEKARFAPGPSRPEAFAASAG